MVDKLMKIIRVAYIFVCVSAFIVMLYGLYIKDYHGVKEMIIVIVTTFIIWLGNILIDKLFFKHQ